MLFQYLCLRLEMPLLITVAFHFAKMEATTEYQGLFTIFCVGAAEIGKQTPFSGCLQLR